VIPSARPCDSPTIRLTHDILQMVVDDGGGGPVSSRAHLTPRAQKPARLGRPAARRRPAALPRCLLGHLSPWGAAAQQDSDYDEA